MYSYSELNQETKAVLNKAMDIYSTIKNNVIKKKIKIANEERDYILNLNDKKVLSLFMACLLANSSLKSSLQEYDNLNVENFFDFLSLKEDEITKLAENEYNLFYEANFKFSLMIMIKRSMLGYMYKEITPEIIYCSFRETTVGGTSILNYFSKVYGISGSFFADHPSFESIKEMSFEKGIIKKTESMSLAEAHTNFTPAEDINFEILSKPKNKQIYKLGDDELWEILDQIKAKFIGQEVAAEYLFYNLVNNQELADQEDVFDGERSVIFIDGPTGTGKTAITREITDKLGIPFTTTALTNYSGVGYKGADLTDTLKNLYRKANGNLELAQRGIIVFDEMDKIAYSNDGLEMKKAVQQQLLDFMGGGKYNITFDKGFLGKIEIEFDTSKLTFVCLGALTDLRKEKTENHSVGFLPSDDENNSNSYTISPKDLQNIGFEDELVGRLNTFLHTNEYSKEDLLRILKESSISPMISFERWINRKGKKLVLGEGVYEAIVDMAYELNTGARSLQTVMNNLRTPFIREVFRGTEDTIYLDAETVININSDTLNRKRVK